jgi:hypothetical protein
MEIWEDIEEFPNYEVSNLGRVRSCKFDTIKVLKPGIKEPTKGCRYHYVILRKDNYPFNRTVHRLVGKAFIPNPENKPQIDHINRNGLDNRIENLRWATRSENLINRTLPIGESGHRYICITNSGAYKVLITRNRETVFYNCYAFLEEAIAGRDAFLATLETST